MSVYETGLGATDSELVKMKETNEVLRDDSVDTKDYQSRIERMEQRNAERNKAEEIRFGSSRASGETLEKYERLEKQRKQQEQRAKDAEKEFKRTVKAAGTPQGNDYWVNKRKQEYESSLRDLEKTKKQIEVL